MPLRCPPMAECSYQKSRKSVNWLNNRNEGHILTRDILILRYFITWNCPHLLITVDSPLCTCIVITSFILLSFSTYAFLCANIFLQFSLVFYLYNLLFLLMRTPHLQTASLSIQVPLPTFFFLDKPTVYSYD